MKNRYQDLEKKIGITFRNKDLLENAFIHRSYLNEHKKYRCSSNEKLEFLGDSVLSLVTSIYLYKNYPHMKEGDYTEIKSSIVRTKSLAEVARELSLGQYLLLSKGEAKAGGRENDHLLENCFEALVCSIFIDKGFSESYQFIKKFLFKNRLKNIIDNNLYQSPKTHLQELTQRKYKIKPEYRVIKEEGPSHKKIFTVAVYIRKNKIAIGTGRSKKIAEEKGARNALQKTF